ncbi:MAG: cytochrome c oxidase subunit II [Burkholderiales bacterium]|nr:cytochrome c oxidase subunit II [Burkholderiales bacterium]
MINNAKIGQVVSAAFAGQMKAICGTLRAGLLALVGMVSSAHAAYDVNIPPPATGIAGEIYDLHLYILVICVIIFVLVFGAMFYSVFKFRKSQGAKPDVNFHESTLIEIIWTVIPFIILIVMAIPATKTVLAMKDTSNPDLTIKVVGYQWGWQYEYQQDGLSFYSNLATPWSQVGQPGVPATEAKGPNYLLEVDNPMVVPVGKKVRLLITSNDVLHGWYVPTLGVNQYGIPGFIKDSWFKVDKAGTYKGQCSQICGKLHGYMPITVVAKDQADYDAWVKEAKTKFAIKSEAPVAAEAPKVAALVDEPGKKWTVDELKQAGESLYSANCAACHQGDGKGNAAIKAKALDGSAVVVGQKGPLLAVLLKGRQGTLMSGFDRLSDVELAAIATYTRNSWGNKTGDALMPADVKAARK